MSDSAGSAFFDAVLDSLDSHVAVIDGVIVYVSGDTPDRMLARANAALYDAKRSGRNCVVLLEARA